MWKSSKIEDGSRHGINNAGQEMMKEDRIKNLVRESIQNSLDAIDDETRPLRFEIEKVKIYTSDIPGIDELINRFELIKKSWPNDNKVTDFCNNALRQLNSGFIYGLRVSDYNTTGLLGINNPNGAFNSLVKGTGYSVKTSTNSGGSFGIGKSVFWANSSLRTVFINSKNIDGETGFIGRSELATVEKNSELYSHIMYYGDENYHHFDYIPASFSNIISRIDENGTDILVLGLVDYDIKETFEYEVLKSVISEFHISIKKGLLEFTIINDNTINVNSNNLNDIIHDLEKIENDSKYFVETLEMSLVYSNEFKYEYDYNGQKFNIYMKQSNNGLKVIKGIRNTGMMIHKFVNRGIYSDIISIVEIKDDYLSTLFKEMENPEHNKWDPSLIESIDRRKEAKAAMSYINERIRETLNIVCPVDDTKRFTIESLNQLMKNNADGNTVSKRSATITKAPERKIKTEIDEQEANSIPGNDFLDIEHNDSITKTKDDSTTNNKKQIFEEGGAEVKLGKNMINSNVKILSIGNHEYNIFVRNLSSGSYYLDLFIETEVSNRSESISNYTTSLVKTNKGVTFTTPKDISTYTLIGSINLKSNVKKSIGGNVYEARH